MNLSATSGYVKFTMATALAIFAYARSQVESGSYAGFGDLFDLSRTGGWLALAMVLLVASALMAGFVISAVTGDANDRARSAAALASDARARAARIAAGGRLDPTEAETDAAEKADSRMKTVHFWTNAHLFSLGLGILIVGVCYILDLVSPAEDDTARCRISDGRLSIDFDCDHVAAETVGVPGRDGTAGPGSGIPRIRGDATW